MINVGFCSYGYSTKVFHLPFINALKGEYTVKAFVERHNNESGKIYPDAKIYRSCEEMFADPDVNLVIVNTPNPTHFEYAQKALKAGKHVVIDKPFAATVEEGQKLIDLAKQNNLLLTVFHNRRWEGELLAVKQIADKGILGRLIEAEFKFERYRSSLNPKRHKEEDAPANGIVYELGTHLIDQALFIFGMPKALYADICKVRDFSQTDDFCSIILYYPNQFRVTLKSSLLVAEQGPAYIMHGNAGSFTKYRANTQEADLANGKQPNGRDFGLEDAATFGKLSLWKDDKIETELYPSPLSSYISFYQILADAFEGKAQVPVSPNDALNGLKIINAAYISSKEHRAVQL